VLQNTDYQSIITILLHTEPIYSSASVGRLSRINTKLQRQELTRVGHCSHYLRNVFK